MADITADKDRLRELFKQCKDAREKIRYQALYLIASGYKIGEVAYIVCSDEDTVRGWIAKWVEKGEVKDCPRPGAGKKITPEIEAEICALVDEDNPGKYGFLCSHWDCKELSKYLERNKGLTVSEEAIRQVLLRNGFRFVKTGYKFLLANPQDQEKFKAEFQTFIGENGENSEVYFLDTMSNKLHPKNGYMWTREQKPKIGTNCSKEKAWITAAVSPFTGKKFDSVTQVFNADEFVSLLEKIERDTDKGKQIILFVDNHRAHHSKKVNAFLKEHRRIKLVFIPPYSPELNPVESLWNYLRLKFLNNRLFLTLKEMIDWLDHILSSLSADLIKSVCSVKALMR